MKKYIIKKILDWAKKQYDWCLFDEVSKSDKANFQKRNIEVVFHNPKMIFSENVCDVNEITSIQLDDFGNILSITM